MAIECSGPIKGLVVEANAFGEVRGFLKNVPIPMDRPMANFDLSRFFGAGFLSVKRMLQDARRPFTGQIALKYGNIAQDLAHYYLESEQIPTAFNLSIKFDRSGEVTGAGGLMLQAMPGADDRLVDDLEGRVAHLPSPGIAFGQAEDPETFIRKNFSEYTPEFLDDRRVEFMCHCNKEKVRHMLMMLPMDELKDMADKGPFPMEIRCHHCNTPYTFSESDLAALYKVRHSKHTPS